MEEGKPIAKIGKTAHKWDSELLMKW